MNQVLYRYAGYLFVLLLRLRKHTSLSIAEEPAFSALPILTQENSLCMAVNFDAMSGSLSHGATETLKPPNFKD